MNDQEIDRLFRQKLEPMEAMPSAQAWKSLEKGLQHKKKKRLWVYVSGIAAGLLLLLGTWGALEYSNQLIPGEQLADTGKKAESRADAPQEKSIATIETAEDKKEYITKETPLVPARDARVAINRPTEKKSSRKQTFAQGSEEILAATEEKNHKSAPESLPRPEAISRPLETEALAIAATPAAVAKPTQLLEEVVISYRADEEETSIATNTTASSTDTDKGKEISARKVLGFLKKVTDNSNAGLAELREAKNELLSLNRFSRPD